MYPVSDCGQGDRVPSIFHHIERQAGGAILAITVGALVGIYGLIRFDLTVAVSYRAVPVMAVQSVPGYDAGNRLVAVDLGENHRVLRTSDPYVIARQGQLVCVKETRFLLRRWTTYALSPAIFCGEMRRFGNGKGSAGLEGPAMSP